MFDEDLPLLGSAQAASDGASYDDDEDAAERYDLFSDDDGGSVSQQQPPLDDPARSSNDHQSPSRSSHANSHGGLGSRRSRGSRGKGSRGGASGGNSSAKPKWRSGQVPPAPTFDGDIDKEPYCLRHYKKKLSRWVMITKEFLPANEQALRAREQMKGEAELELAEIEDQRYDHQDGI